MVRISGESAIRLFLSHPSLRSWWSFGWIRIVVVSFARTEQAKQTILKNLPGSNHSTKKFPAYSKITFDCDNVYEAGATQRRWGPRHELIINLCRQTKVIAQDRRMGYGNVMGNLIFYHSVPNNVPGMLYSKNKGWKPLFPDRLMPTWLNDLLKSPPPSTHLKKINLPQEAYDVLSLLKKGLKTRSAIARRLELDIKIINQTVSACISHGLITKQMRLTHEGAIFLKNQKSHLYKDFTPNYSMYIPKSWCTGHNPPSRPCDESSELSEDGDF
ncbi:phosphoribosyltransferase-like protein [Pseudodesulfovibrio profundus]